MPTAYIKKLAKLNHTTVNKIEKFWAQAKEIAKSEGNGKAWGLITTIFQNKLKKEGYKIKAIAYDSVNSPESTKKFYEDLETELKNYRESKVVSDTDELDDADLGINVDPKEYHKQKSLQMSLQSKLDMIKKDINKEADDYNEELIDIAKKLNKGNRKRYSRDNEGDKWLHYTGTVNKEVLLEAYKDGLSCVYRYEGFGTITSDEDIRDELNYFNNSVYPRFKKLIKGSLVRVYRGLDFHRLLCSNKDLLKDYFKYLKYNLMDRNSWTTSIEVAKRYTYYKWSSIILQMDCTLEDVNLPLSAWLEGYWCLNKNKEINLKKSLKVKNIKCVFVGDDLKKLEFNEKEFNKVVAFKEETREVDDKKFIFKRLSLSDCVNQIKDLFDDYFNFGKKDPEYYEKLHNTKVDESIASDLLSDDTTVYVEYNDGSKWYSVNNPKLKDLKLTGIKNCIIEYPAYTAYFGKDCRIERFDNAEDSPYVIKCEAKMKQFKYKGQVITASSKEEAINSTTKNKLDYIGQVKDCIKKIWARGTRNQQEFYAKDWTARYSRIIDDCINAFEEPKVCARMMYIKYHKENPLTRDLNKNHDTDFYTLLKEAKQYFEGLKKWKGDDELLNELNKQVTASTGDNMKCNLDKNSMNLLKSIGFEFRPSHDNEGETLDAYRTAKGKYEWIMCLGKKEATEGYQYRYFLYKNRNDMLLGRKAIKDVDFKNKKELLDYFKLKATASTESKVFAYKGETITASSREDAIKQIVGGLSINEIKELYKKASDEVDALKSNKDVKFKVNMDGAYGEVKFNKDCSVEYGIRIDDRKQKPQFVCEVRFLNNFSELDDSIKNDDSDERDFIQREVNIPSVDEGVTYIKNCITAFREYSDAINKAKEVLKNTKKVVFDKKFKKGNYYFDMQD